MLVRIQLKAGPRPKKRSGFGGRVAVALSSVLGPASLMVGALGLWRLAARFHLADDFDFHHPILSRWEYLLGAAVALQLAAVLIDRSSPPAR